MGTDLLVLSFLLTAMAIGCLPVLIRYIREQKDPRGPSRRAVSRAVAGEIGLVLVAIASYGIGTVQQKPFVAQRQTKQNMKAISAALIQYSEDWGDRLPPANRWQDAISQPKYFPDADYAHVLTCPSDGTPRGYAINAAVAGHKLSAVDAPTITVLLYETDKPRRNASGSGDDQAPPRHGRQTVALCDGSVSQYNAATDDVAMQWTVQGDHPLSRR